MEDALNLHRSALLVIDLQNDFLDGWNPLRLARLLSATNELAAQFRTAGKPIFWIRQEFSPNLSDAFPEMRARKIAINIAGTRGAALHAELEWRQDDRVIVKKRYSAFFGTDLEVVLSAAGVDCLVIAGINTHACIRMTAIDAYQRDLHVVLAAEAIDSYDLEHARMSLAYMDGKIATVLTNARIGETLGLGRS